MWEMLSGFRELHFGFKEVFVWTSMGQAQLTNIKNFGLKLHNTACFDYQCLRKVCYSLHKPDRTNKHTSWPMHRV